MAKMCQNTQTEYFEHNLCLNKNLPIIGVKMFWAKVLLLDTRGKIAMPNNHKGEQPAKKKETLLRSLNKSISYEYEMKILLLQK